MSILKFKTEAKNGRLIYPIVLCLNERGMATTKNVNSGFRIVTSPPTSTHAQVSIVTPSTTFYSRINPYQSQTVRLVFTWNGFFDSSGATMTYEFALVGPKGSRYTEEWRKLPGSNVRLFILEGLSFETGKTYNVKVRAVNAANLASDPVTTKVVIDSSPPSMTKDQVIVRKDKSDQFSVDWSAVFKDESPMYFEVAIGSGQGKTDVFGFIETKQTSLSVKKAKTSTEYHFVISAINSAGLFTRTFYKLHNFALAA